MDLDDIIKLLETAKSPALVLLCLIAWQTVRAVARGLTRLEAIDEKLGQITAGLLPLASQYERMEKRLDDIHDDLTRLPLGMVRHR